MYASTRQTADTDSFHPSTLDVPVSLNPLRAQLLARLEARQAERDLLAQFEEAIEIARQRREMSPALFAWVRQKVANMGRYAQPQPPKKPIATDAPVDPVEADMELTLMVACIAYDAPFHGDTLEHYWIWEPFQGRGAPLEDKIHRFMMYYK